jgi:hypothetical protein
MARAPIKKRRFKQSPADATEEELDRVLDRRGYTGSPNKGEHPSKRSNPDAMMKQKEAIMESMKGLASGGKADIEDPEEVMKKRRRPIINAVVGFKKTPTSA